MPISGIGGVTTWRDAAEFIALGCGTVQVCTAAMTYGFRVVQEMVSGLGQWMDDHGHADLDAIRGRAVPNVTDWQYLNLNYVAKARIDQDLCIQCGRCFAACEDTSHQAIAMLPGRVFEVKDDECVACNLCVNVCPVEDCITMVALEPGTVDARTGKVVQPTYANWTTHPNNPMAQGRGVGLHGPSGCPSRAGRVRGERRAGPGPRPRAEQVCPDRLRVGAERRRGGRRRDDRLEAVGRCLPAAPDEEGRSGVRREGVGEQRVDAADHPVERGLGQAAGVAQVGAVQRRRPVRRPQAAAEVGREQCRAAETGAAQVRPGERCRAQAGAGEIGAPQVGARERGGPEFRAGEAGVGEIGAVEPRAPEVGLRQVCAGEDRPRGLGTDEHGSGEVCPVQPGPRKARAGEVRPGQRRAAQVGPVQRSALEVRTRPAGRQRKRRGDQSARHAIPALHRRRA